MGAALIDICSEASRRLSKLDLAPMLSSRNPKRGKIHRISGAGSWLYCISWVRDPIGTLKCSNEKLKVLEKKSGVPANCALRYIHSKKEFVQGGVFPAGLLWTWCTSSSTTKIPSGEIERRQHMTISYLGPQTANLRETFLPVTSTNVSHPDVRGLAGRLVQSSARSVAVCLKTTVVDNCGLKIRSTGC